MSGGAERDRSILGAFAELLGYPGPEAAAQARACARAVEATCAGAADRLERFAGACDAAAPGRLEELYTAAFDLAPVCPPYVGHQLFGEGRERALFLARLRAMQHEEGVVPGCELPDHVCEVLRFLASSRDGADRDALLSDALAPALDKMRDALAQAHHPWADVVAALGEIVRLQAAAATRAAACREAVP